MFPINWNDVFRKKDGTLGTMEDLGGGSGSDLPEYDSGDAGKVLAVDDEGLLEWKELDGGTKIYYKDYSLSFGTTENLAKFSDNAASAGSFNIAIIDSSTRDVTVNGYTPISVMAHDVSTGYSIGILLEYQVVLDVPRYQLSFVIANRGMASYAIKARVFYAKNEDLVALT